MHANGQPLPVTPPPLPSDGTMVPREGEESEPERFFRAGVVLLEKLDRVGDALIAFKKAHEMRPLETRYASYYGLCLAIARRDTREAIPICMDAIRRDFYRPELFLNLGRVYLMGRDRENAYKTFRVGLKLDEQDLRLKREVARMGVRKKPVFPFLERGHPLNRVSGRWLARAGLR